MYKGDIAFGQIVNFKFTSRDSTGTPSLLSGATLVIFRDNSTSEFSQGLSVTTNFDSVAGLNHVTVTTGSGSTVFLEGHDYDVVISGGQVSTVTVVGEVVGQFSVSNRYGGATAYGKLQAVASTSQVSLPSTATTDNDAYTGALMVTVPGGPGGSQARYISDYTGATYSAQLDSALGTAVTSATTVVVYPGAPATTVNADIKKINGATLTGDGSTTSWGPA